MTRSISLILSLALVITAVASPGASAARAEGLPTFAPFEADLRSPDAREGLPAVAPVYVDLRSPDARDSGDAPVVQARGTDVAAPDQLAPKTPVGVPASVPAADDGFDWTDAGLGAAGFAALAIALGGVAAALRMRRGPVRAS